MSKENEKKKSKYLRDSSAPASKYIRSKDDKPTSKYIKADNEKGSKKKSDSTEKKTEYRKSVMTPKRARENMLEEELASQEELTLETAETEAAEAVETPEVPEISENTNQDIFRPDTESEPEPEQRNEHIKSKGTANDMYKDTEEGDGEKRAKFYRKEEAKKSLKHNRKQAVIRAILCILVLAFFAVLLQFGAFPFPTDKIPKGLTTEFSTIPELIASIAYGPLVGVLICFIKNVILILFRSTNIMSSLTNLLLDSSFVFIAGLIYSKSMFSGDKKVVQPKNNKRKDYRRRRIFLSSLSGAVISAVPQFFITRYIAYPGIVRLNENITFDSILALYRESYDKLLGALPQFVSRIMPEMNSISKAIIIYNLPLTFIKLFIVTVFTALIYKYISPFLHYREKNKKKKSKPKTQHRR